MQRTSTFGGFRGATAWGVALGLLALQINPWFRSRTLLQWQLAILGSEFSPYWALASLALLALTLRTVFSRSGGKLGNGALALLFAVSAGLSAGPTISAFRDAPAWRAEFETQFGRGVEAQQPWIRLATLWLGLGTSGPAPLRRLVRTADGTELPLDFYPAQGREDGSAPWVVVVHGGGWDSGDLSQLSALNHHLARKGYAVAAVSYRLTPKWKWPVQREDVGAAVVYLRAHAKELGIAPDRWAILGRSAGGQIAEAIAYPNPEQPAAHAGGRAYPGPKACISFYAPADLNFAYRHSVEDDILRSRDLLRSYLGGTPDEAPGAYDDASPIRFVTAQSPPTLLFHGPIDALVWHRQSERLLARLREAGVNSQLISLSWVTHGFDYNLSGPGGQISTSAIDRFLAQTL